MKTTQQVALGSLAILALALFGTAQAGESGFYLGGSIGQSQVEAAVDDDIPEIPEFDENDTGWKIFAGYNWQLAQMFNLGLEGGYVNFGKPSQVFDVDGTDVTLSVEPTGINLWGTAGVVLGPVDLYGKLGMISWDADLAASAPGEDTESFSEDGNDVGYGIGGRLNLGQFGIRLEYEIYDIEDSDDVSMWSLGAEWRFN